MIQNNPLFTLMLSRTKKTQIATIQTHTKNISSSYSTSKTECFLMSLIPLINEKTQEPTHVITIIYFPIKTHKNQHKFGYFKSITNKKIILHK
jgi:hypothetical protein